MNGQPFAFINSHNIDSGKTAPEKIPSTTTATTSFDCKTEKRTTFSVQKGKISGFFIAETSSRIKISLYFFSENDLQMNFRSTKRATSDCCHREIVLLKQPAASKQQATHSAKSFLPFYNRRRSVTQQK